MNNNNPNYQQQHHNNYYNNGTGNGPSDRTIITGGNGHHQSSGSNGMPVHTLNDLNGVQGIGQNYGHKSQDGVKVMGTTNNCSIAVNQLPNHNIFPSSGHNINGNIAQGRNSAHGNIPHNSQIPINQFKHDNSSRDPIKQSGAIQENGDNNDIMMDSQKANSKYNENGRRESGDKKGMLYNHDKAKRNSRGVNDCATTNTNNNQSNNNIVRN